MREILFRAYAKDIKQIKEVVFINLERKFATLNMGYADIDKKHEWTSMYKFEDIELMQYTGLTDKNDNTIFEGDIVVNHATKGTVIFEDGMFTLTMSANVQFGKYKQPLCYLDMESSEVIGNIHERENYENK